MPHTQQSHIHTEEQCGYCRKVQSNHGGNIGYKCKRHKKSVTVVHQKYYTEEGVNALIDQALSKQRKEVLETLTLSSEFVKYKNDSGHGVAVSMQKIRDALTSLSTEGAK